MKIYLDDTTDGKILIVFLKNAGFQLVSPRMIGMRHKDDIDHLQLASNLDAVVLTFDRDFSTLHEVYLTEKKEHKGIFLIYQYNNPRKDMAPGQIVKAIKNLLALNLPIQSNLYILNQFKY